MKEKQPERPVLFMKPPSCFQEIKDNARIVLPWDRGSIHYECEVVLKLYKKNVIGIGLGLDLTLRDVQKKCKENGHPWEIAKCFKNSALVTPIKGTRDFPKDWQSEVFRLKVNGEVKQESSLSQAIMKADQIIHYIDEFFPINDGDLVFTGTPSGVGPLKPNDLLDLEFGPIKNSFMVVENGF
jgi:2-keto-4-pentenoate hydratase/2-oxohepta-3-ene-1,7-dioic acid hydratase in catechol pathway